MSTGTSRAIAALRSGHDELVRRTATIGPAELARRSAAAEWTVADVLSHLGSGAEIMSAMLDAALGRAPAPSEGSREAVWDRWNATAPQDQARGCLRANEELVGRFEGLDQAQRAELRIDMGFLPQPADVSTAASLRLNEFSLHSWDIAVIDDPAAELAPESVEFLFAPLEMLIGWIAEPGTTRTIVAVHTTEPDRSFGLELGAAAAIIGPPFDAKVLLTIPAEAFLRLTAGRLAPRHTPAGIRLEGDPITLDGLLAVFPGF